MPNMGVFENTEPKKKNDDEPTLIVPTEIQKKYIVVKWENANINIGDHIIVDANHTAVLTDKTKIFGTLPYGDYMILPGTNNTINLIIDKLRQNPDKDIEIFFVSTEERTTVPFGGPIGIIKIQNINLSIRIVGEFIFKVHDPIKLILTIAGTNETSTVTDTSISDWVTRQVLATIREEIPQLLENKGILNPNLTQKEAEQKTTKKANKKLERYGLEITNFGKFDLITDRDDIEIFSQRPPTQPFTKPTEPEQPKNNEPPNTLPNSLEQKIDNLNDTQHNTTQIDINTLTPTINFQITVETKTPCRACENAIPDTASFCPNCGTPQTCPQCDKHMGAGYFCPHCGYNART